MQNEAYVLDRKTTWALAITAGTAVSNLYFNQPMLAMIQRDLPEKMTGAVPTATQVGYTLGLLFLVPLGDIVNRKKLILIQFFFLTLSLVGAAVAPTGFALVLASIAIGIGSSVTQQIVPLAAHLAPPAKRGAIVGMVVSGLLCGILLSRTIAGFVSLHSGWRAMFWLGVPIAFLGAVGMKIILPDQAPLSESSYTKLLRSMGGLWSEFPELRLAVITQGFLFASFSMFWTVLAYHLAEPHFNMGSDVAGLFGVVGAVGVLAAPLAGKFADRNGPRPVIVMGVVLSMFSWGIFGFWNSIPGLILGVIVLDFAVQGVLVSHQSIIFALRPEARGRINTIFMSGMFLGGAIGSATAIHAWGVGGWSRVVWIAASFSGLAGLIQAAVTLKRRSLRT
ncbi:MAG: MFS transporter [Proteobacteria bacterium]|nr:MAG: MFS transporter [Pseudomonadota bacterium]